MVLSRFQGGELRISPSTTSLPVRCLLPMPVPRLIPIMSSVNCARRMRPLSSVLTAPSSSARPARKCTKSRRCLPTTSTSRLTRPCREGPPHLPPGFFIVRSILNMRSTLTARLTRLPSVQSALWIFTVDIMSTAWSTSPRNLRVPYPLW